MECPSKIFFYIKNNCFKTLISSLCALSLHSYISSLLFHIRVNHNKINIKGSPSLYVVCTIVQFLRISTTYGIILQMCTSSLLNIQAQISWSAFVKYNFIFINLNYIVLLYFSVMNYIESCAYSFQGTYFPLHL